MDPGKLYIISTPIGNLEDITHRALRVLGESAVLACEDTRVTRKIFARYDVEHPGRLISYHEHNEESAGKKILDLLSAGQNVSLCSDSGTPGISDPGYRIIDAALDAGCEVEAIPGTSAITTALAASGLPTSSFTFKGFPPRKPGQRRRFLEMDKDLPHTLVFYESPHRFHKLLIDALDVYGDRKAAVCKELTKKFERIFRGYLSDLIDETKDLRKGEFTVVVAGNNEKFIRNSAG